MDSRYVSRYATLDRARLAALVPELLLIGQLIDRSAMAWCISAFGRREMSRIAIEEWMAASPVYTRRMQRALGYEGTDVVTIFKGLQLDIGAPPQFMDFRYTVHDARHGEFRLDHCGALMDVEPLGEAYVTAMCHDIEDPTFDATAVATNPRARVRPVHRPPRVPADRHPHCRWTVTIDEENPPVAMSPACEELLRSRAAGLDLSPVDPADEGRADYGGPLLSDLRFADFSSSALVRIADEVCLQMHLLNLGFVRAVRGRTDPARAREICVRTLTGIAGLASMRIARAVGLPATAAGALRVLELHPLLNPAAYVSATVAGGVLRVGCPSAAHDDGAWISLCGPGEPRPLAALVRAVDPHLDIEYPAAGNPGPENPSAERSVASRRAPGTSWAARVVTRSRAAPECDEVAVTRISTGSSFAFTDRPSIPITPV